MAEPKMKPPSRVAGKSKFRLPDRPPRVVETNPLRDILEEAKAQEDALAAKRQFPTPAKNIAGVGKPKDQAKPEQNVHTTPAKNIAGVADKQERLVLTRAGGQSFKSFMTRWAPVLRSGQMSVCKALFDMTHALGEAECFTSMPKLAAASGLKERQCYNVVNQLEALGFIERPEIFNTPTKKGTVFRLHLSPQTNDLTRRHYHIGGND